MSRQKQTPKKRSSPVWVKAFLASFSQTGNVLLSCQAAKVSRPAVYDRRNTDAAFASAWDAAKEEAADLMVREARRRATEGVARLKFHQGQLITIPLVRDGQPVLKDGQPVMVPYVEHEYSDTLLIFLLKGARPEEYRDNHKHEHTGSLTQTHIYLPKKDDVPAG